MSDKLYSEKLHLHFKVLEDGTVEFEDGMTYSREEQQLIKGLSAQDLQTTHYVEKLFEGAIIRRRPPKKEDLSEI